MNNTSCLTTLLLVTSVVVGAWKNSLVLSIQILVLQGLGYTSVSDETVKEKELSEPAFWLINTLCSK